MKNLSLHLAGFLFGIFTITAQDMNFAHRGEISSANQSDKLQQPMLKSQHILLPGNWANVTIVETLIWTVGEENDPAGFAFGNNTFGDMAAGQHFVVEQETEILGAYFWFGSVEAGTGQVLFTVWDFDGSVGEVLTSVSMDLADLEAFPTTVGVTPDQYMEAFYVEFDAPLTVTSDFLIGVDFSALTWNEHGDGVGLASSSDQDEMAGMDQAWIQIEGGEWTLASVVNESLDLDIAVFVATSEAIVEQHQVTFNVDMTGAVAQGDIVFDPEIHDVYITGTFADWVTPGENVEFQMQPAQDPVKNQVEVFYEDFAGSFPEDWENNVISFEGFPGFEWTDEGGAFGGQLESTTADNGYLILNSDAHGSGDAEEVELLSPPIDLSEAIADVEFSVEHVARTFGAAEVYIYVSTDDFATQTELYSWSGAEQHQWNTEDGTQPSPHVIVSSFDITEMAAGQSNVRFKFRWIGAFDYWWLIDDVRVMADMGEPSDEMIYTITLDVDEGEHAYKYFLVEDEPTFDIGEWAGAPDRMVTITGPETFNDVWGSPTSVNDIVDSDNAMTVFPNPALTNISINSEQIISEIRIFDVAGRMVYSRNFNDYSVVINVADFNTGMYFMQIFTENGAETHKIQVMR